MANDDKDLRLLFECDPVKNTECTKEGCYLFGGDCSWTTKPECSKDGAIGFTLGEKLTENME